MKDNTAQARKMALSSLVIVAGLLALFQKQCQSLDRMAMASQPQQKMNIAVEESRNKFNNQSMATTRTSTSGKQASRPIRQISILGERNSGTRWTFSHLSECFNHSLHVKRHLTRYKHWFQHPNATNYRQRDGTLVISQFRDPYDWLESMRDHPHHAPKHLDVGWKEFLTTPWTMERIGTDLVNKTNSSRCHQDFSYNEVVSCDRMPVPREAYENIHMSRHLPIYELRQDGSGLPFESIIEMRAAKIRNFLETREYPTVVGLWPVQYEYLLAKGTKDMLDAIAERTGVPYQCNPFPIQVRRKRPISKQFAAYVSQHVDWTTEALIGYSKNRERRRNQKHTKNDNNAQGIAGAADQHYYQTSFLLEPNELSAYFYDQEVLDEVSFFKE